MSSTISKKICLLGSYSVGKTSLTKRFVHSLFSEKYHTTIGVKVDKKILHCHDNDVQFLIWDIEGRDEFTTPNLSYLRGAAGYLLVVDCTRPKTLQTAIELQAEAETALGPQPFLMLLNKMDLTQNRQIKFNDLPHAIQQNWSVIETSAKTGKNVEFAFQKLADQIMARHMETSP